MQERIIEPDHHPEVVDAGKGTRRLELLGLDEVMGSPDARRLWFEQLGTDGFVKMLGYVNSIIRQKPISYQFQDGQLPMVSTPPPADKDRLVREAFDATRDVLSDAGLSNEVALRRAGLTVAGAINYIHPYDDGNGRTGRVIHYLLEYGLDRGEQVANDELYAILSRLPVHEGHWGQVINDSPPGELTMEIDRAASVGENYADRDLDGRAAATRRVELFLKMMKGDLYIPLHHKIVRVRPANPASNDPKQRMVVPAGTLDGRSLYEYDYEADSTVAHFDPHDAAERSRRIVGRHDLRPKMLIRIPIDVLPVI